MKRWLSWTAQKKRNEIFRKEVHSAIKFFVKVRVRERIFSPRKINPACAAMSGWIARQVRILSRWRSRSGYTIHDCLLHPMTRSGIASETPLIIIL